MKNLRFKSDKYKPNRDGEAHSSSKEREKINHEAKRGLCLGGAGRSARRRSRQLRTRGTTDWETETRHTVKKLKVQESVKKTR